MMGNRLNLHDAFGSMIISEKREAVAGWLKVACGDSNTLWGGSIEHIPIGFPRFSLFYYLLDKPFTNVAPQHLIY